MMQIVGLKTNNWKGLNLHVTPQRIEPSEFVIDQNGDRTKLGAWRSRPGYCDLQDDKFYSKPIRALAGLRGVDSSFFMLHQESKYVCKTPLDKIYPRYQTQRDWAPAASLTLAPNTAKNGFLISWTYPDAWTSGLKLYRKIGAPAKLMTDPLATLVGMYYRPILSVDDAIPSFDYNLDYYYTGWLFSNALQP